MESTPANAPEENHAFPKGNGELILMVDDEKSVLNMASIVFEMSGYKVITASHAGQAFEAYEQQSKNISAVLLDLTMPIMDGIELSRRLVEIDPEVKIIVSSGQTTPDKELELRNLGVHHFLHKPYNASQLLKTMRDVISPQEAMA